MTDNGTLVLQSCTVALRAEHGLCSETSVQSSDDSNEVITIKIVGEVVRIKEEDEPQVSPQTFHQYLGFPSVIMPVCLLSGGEWKWSICSGTSISRFSRGWRKQTMNAGKRLIWETITHCK
jgi:hypothetical protein